MKNKERKFTKNSALEKRKQEQRKLEKHLKTIKKQKEDEN